MNDADVTFWPNLVTPNGVRKQMPWGRLFMQFSEWRPFAGDKEHPGWSAATFDGDRRALDAVQSVTALVLDYDDGTPLPDVEAKWRHLRGLIHTTRKHAHDAHRCRVILPFSRAVTRAEYETIWARRAPYNTDRQTKDASRFWFLPGSPNAGTYQSIWLDGAILDVDAVLAESPPPEPQERRQPAGDDAERRASAYIAKMPPAISGAKGHGALWQVALVVVNGFGLSPNAAFNLIKHEYNPRCQPPWSDREISHKVGDAANKAKVPFGFKLNEDRDWHRTPASVAAGDPDGPPIGAAAPQEPAPEPERGDAWEPPDGAAPEPPPPPAPFDPIQHYAVRSVAELLNGVFVRASTEKPRGGCPSGVVMIDKQLGGFRRGMVTILGASTSWGKSSFALMASEASFAIGKRVILVSGEDTEDTYGARIMAKRAQVNAMRLRDNLPNPVELSRMAGAVKDAEQDPFFINGIGKTAEDMATAIKQICAKRDIDLVIVDYVQAFSCARRCQDRRVEIGHIARCFIEAIKVSGAAGLVLSQLKRLENNKAATMHDLKEAGDLENMAEHVLVGWVEREGVDSDGPDRDTWKRFVSLEKNKDGPRLPHPLELRFDSETASFTGEVIY